MLTTTPRFRPREGCDPRPTTSMRPSCVISPTIATTFDVPMSRPTIRLRSFFLDIWRCVLGAVREAGGRVPADRETVAVAQVDVADLGGALRDHRTGHPDEALEARFDVLPAEAHTGTVAERELPRAARIELDLRQPHADREQARISLEVQLRDLRFGARGSDELRQLRRNVPRMAQEQLTARIHESGLAPARDGHMLGDEHAHPIRPAALDARAVDPRNAFERGAQCVEIDGEETGAPERRDHFLDLHRCDTLKLTADFHLSDRPIEGERQSPHHDAEADHHAGQAERGLQPTGEHRLEPGEREAATAAFRLATIAFTGGKHHGRIPLFMARVPRDSGSSPESATPGRRTRCRTPSRPSARASGWSCPASCSLPAGSWRRRDRA